MSEQTQRPTPDEGSDAWRAYWTAQGMPWRTEPEIDIERQRFLAERRVISVEAGISPFTDVKLDRADLEWLLATHMSGDIIGPVDYSDPQQRTHEGLDLREADLSHASLSRLPLDRSNLRGARLEAADLADTSLRGAILDQARLERASLAHANLSDASLLGGHLEGAYLVRAQLNRCVLARAHLERASLREANLQAANLTEAHLEGADFTLATLERADLRAAFLDASSLVETRVSGARLADIRWGDANVAGIDWAHVRMLGDEQYARRRRTQDGQPKDRATRIAEYWAAARAYRGLLPLLEERSDNAADRFAYRAQVLQRQVKWLQREWGAWFGSLILDLVAGYGYKPFRLVLTYLVIVGGFAALYYIMSRGGDSRLTPLSPIDAYIFSLQVVIGRTVPGSGVSLPLSDPINAVADTEILTSLVYGFIFANVVSKRLFGG